jgi:hypothetical protein
MLNAYVTLDPIETLYIASLLGDQRRPIDRYIDYFAAGTRIRRCRRAPRP